MPVMAIQDFIFVGKAHSWWFSASAVLLEDLQTSIQRKTQSGSCLIFLGQASLLREVLMLCFWSSCFFSSQKYCLALFLPLTEGSLYIHFWTWRRASLSTVAWFKNFLRSWVFSSWMIEKPKFCTQFTYKWPFSSFILLREKGYKEMIFYFCDA